VIAPFDAGYGSVFNADSNKKCSCLAAAIRTIPSVSSLR
jgi:hypothetical protein